MSTGSSWIQALLLLSRREPPGIEQLREERLRGQVADGAQVSRQTGGSSASTAHVSREQTVISYAGGAPHLADLSRDEPFWPGARHPSAGLLQTLGNEAIVAALPAQLSFLLYCVVCGTGSPAFSWEITRDLEDAGEAEEGSPVVASQPKPLHMQALGRASTFGSAAPSAVCVAIVREPVQVTLAEQGLYAVKVRLNGAEAGRLALFVQLAPPKGNA